MHEVRHVFTQLVRCVEHLHDRGTLHGDIKVARTRALTVTTLRCTLTPFIPPPVWYMLLDTSSR